MFENFYILAVENLISLFDIIFESVGPMNSKQMITKTFRNKGALYINLLENDNNARTL